MKKILSIIVALLVLTLTGCGGIGESGISKDEFDKLSLGMSHSKVDEIIGGEGKLISETSTDLDPGHSISTKTYEYQGETSGKATLTFTFEVNWEGIINRGNSSYELTKKEQSGLS